MPDCITATLQRASSSFSSHFLILVRPPSRRPEWCHLIYFKIRQERANVLTRYKGKWLVCLTGGSGSNCCTFEHCFHVPLSVWNIGQSWFFFVVVLYCFFLYYIVVCRICCCFLFTVVVGLDARSYSLMQRQRPKPLYLWNTKPTQNKLNKNNQAQSENNLSFLQILTGLSFWGVII